MQKDFQKNKEKRIDQFIVNTEKPLSLIWIHIYSQFDSLSQAQSVCAVPD